MECHDVRKLLPGLALGDLDAEPAREVGEHLRGCAACRAGHESLGGALGALRSAESLGPSSERRTAAAGGMAREQAELAERLLSRPRRSRRWAAAAAVLFVGAGAALLALPRVPGPEFTAAAVDGRADHWRAVTGDWAPLAARDALRAGDRLVTQSRTVVRLVAGAGEIVLDQGTSVSVGRGASLSLDRGRLYAELRGGELRVSDTGNNVVTLRRGRAEVGLRAVSGLVAGARQEREGAAKLPEARVDAAERLSIRVAEGEADLAGSQEQRLRAAGGQEGSFDIGGKPSTAPAAGGEPGAWRVPGFYR